MSNEVRQLPIPEKLYLRIVALAHILNKKPEEITVEIMESHIDKIVRNVKREREQEELTV